MKSLLITIITFFTVFGANAYTVKGSVVDEMGEPLPSATVKVLNLKDSTAVKGAITNNAGVFSIVDVPKGKYLLETTYVGYSPIHKEITVNANLDAGKISLAENANMLKEVSVTGIKTPIRVAEDTVEFNADTYKTQPNAVVEDLLKRLPGVEVDTDGKITHNGKEITKILIDGKEFFSDDPKVASKNLPVDMVEKLQVVDRKSDLARMTGVDDGEDETVINLTVKKGMQQGWFGNIEAGYGTDDRYKANFNINRFWNGNQITLLGNANNVNELGFTDGGSRFRGFGSGRGITTSQALGLNFNIGNKEILRVGGNVMYSHSSRDSYTKQDKQNILQDSLSFENSIRNNLTKGSNFRADFRIKWQPDSFNTLEFRPNMSLNLSNSHTDFESQTNAGFRNSSEVGAAVNKNANLTADHGNSREFGARLIYNHNFKQKRGRSFSVFANFRSSNMREKENAYSRIQYFLLGNDTIYDQFANDHTWTNNFSTRVSWTEPLGDAKKGNFLTFAYNFSYRWNNADKLTYNRPVDLDPSLLYLLESLPQDELNDSLSNRFRNYYMNQDIRVGFKHVSKTQNIDVGVSLVPQMSKSDNLIDVNKNIPERWVWNFAPYLRYRYKMTNTRSLNINYFGRSSQPSLTQLQPVADMSNPLSIVQGNPDLKPSFSHSMDFRFQDFNAQAQRSIMVFMRASMTQNSIVSKSTSNGQTGGQFTTYENVNGVWNANAFTMVSFPLKNKAFTINNHFGANYSHNVGFINGDRNNASNLGIFESPGIAWRPDNIELEIRPNYSMQYIHNSLQTKSSTTPVTHSYGGRFNGTYYTPFGLVLSTDLTYTATSGYGADYNKKEWMWNASISQQFLRDRSLVVTASAYDLLQQRSNISRTSSSSAITDQIVNSLTRYFMVSVSYKFNTFGKGRQPGREDMGPGGFGPGRGGFGGGRPPRH